MIAGNRRALPPLKINQREKVLFKIGIILSDTAAQRQKAGKQKEKAGAGKSGI